MNTEKITRVEVIDHREGAERFGRAYSSGIDRGMDVYISEQDEGKTLKIFISDKK